MFARACMCAAVFHVSDCLQAPHQLKIIAIQSYAEIVFSQIDTLAYIFPSRGTRTGAVPTASFLNLEGFFMKITCFLHVIFMWYEKNMKWNFLNEKSNKKCSEKSKVQMVEQMKTKL